MTQSKHEYRDPEGNVLVSIGDELTPDVVRMLGKTHAVRMPTDEELQAERDQATMTAVLEPGPPDTDELVSMIESARDLIAEAAETLRRVANETNDSYRSGTMVANLQVLVETGGWCALEGETLQGWIDELTTK